MTFNAKKIVLFVGFTILVLGIGTLIFYRFFLHTVIAETIQSDPEKSMLIPDQAKPIVIKARRKLDQEINDIPNILDSLNLDFDDLLLIVETIDSDQVIRSINELSNTKLKSEDQVFDIVKKHVTVEGYDLEMFRSAFKKKATMEKINRALKIIKDRQLTTTVSVPVARRTVTQILIDNRQRIEAHLESM